MNVYLVGNWLDWLDIRVIELLNVVVCIIVCLNESIDKLVVNKSNKITSADTRQRLKSWAHWV